TLHSVQEGTVVFARNSEAVHELGEGGNVGVAAQLHGLLQAAAAECPFVIPPPGRHFGVDIDSLGSEGVNQFVGVAHGGVDQLNLTAFVRWQEAGYEVEAGAVGAQDPAGGCRHDP